MGNYKDKNGKSHVGEFLENAKEMGIKIAPSLLQLAGSVTGVDALTDLGNAIKTSDDLSPEMKVSALSMLEFDMAEMQEVTKRHSADMSSDSYLSKNIRPMVLGYSWIFLSVLVIVDAASKSFNVPEFYLNIIVPLFLTVNTFYFGARTYEKYQINKQNK